MKQRTIILMAMLAPVLGVRSQELTVKAMKATNDLSASQYRRLDLNGKPCGLVKVQLATTGATFEGNVIPPVEYKTGEYWVYMTEGSRELRVKHPSFVPLHVVFSDYGIGKGIQSLQCYDLTLLMPQAGQEKKMQKLVVNYTPSQAMVIIDSKPFSGNGHVEALLPLGEHSYMIVASGYITAEGMVKLNGGRQRVITEQLEKDGTTTVTDVQTLPQHNSAPLLTMSGLDPARFDTSIQGKSVKLYTLRNQYGMEACITNYGGRVVSLVVPDREGNPTDVVLGFDNIVQYADTLNSPNDYGSSIGRYANRICDGKFALNGTIYQLRQNDRVHCLHGGGNTGWMNKVYDAEQVDEKTLKLTIVAEDGENGFPGTVTAITTYKITEDNTLDITWEATTDKSTIINQTNHNYYNLSGDFTMPCYDMVLYVNADNFIENDFSSIPTGEVKSVNGTPMDFRIPHAIGDDIHSEFDQIRNAGGYDHNWCLNTYRNGWGDDTQVCASLYSPKTGIFMEMFTNEPGVQVYSGNYQGFGGEENIVHKLGKKYPRHVSVCMESQKYPDSPNHPEWASPILNPGEKYYSHAAYKFSIK